MKRLIVLLSFLPLVSFCQKSDSTKTGRLLFGITFSPDYCYRTLKPDESDIAQIITERREKDEIPVFGFTTGVSMIFYKGKRWALETGLQFSRKGEQTKKIDLVWPQPDPSLPVKVSSVYQYHYLDIPIKANFAFARIQRVPLKFLKKVMRGKIPTSDLSFFVSAGISANVFLNERSILKFEYSDGRTDPHKFSQRTDLSAVNVAAVAGIGMRYYVAQRVSIRIEPVFRHSITPIQDAPIKQYSYSAGVNAGVYFRL